MSVSYDIKLLDIQGVLGFFGFGFLYFPIYLNKLKCLQTAQRNLLIWSKYSIAELRACLLLALAFMPCFLVCV